MQFNIAILLSAIAGLTSATAIAGGCECGIGAIYTVAQRHGCTTPKCACPHFEEWRPEVDAIVKKDCPTQSQCESTYYLLPLPVSLIDTTQEVSNRAPCQRGHTINSLVAKWLT